MTETNLTPDRIIIRQENEPVYLKQLLPEDAESYYALITDDPEYLQFYDDTIVSKYPNTASFKQFIERAEKPNIYRFGVWNDNTLVGGTNLIVDISKGAEIGFWTNKTHSGHGYATSGQRLLLDFAFNDLKLDEVYCEIVEENQGSVALVEKLGFKTSAKFLDTDNTPMIRFTLTSAAYRDQSNEQ